jgi:23S rRNA (guanosine2251-2'-O)-methyltransferase
MAKPHQRPGRTGPRRAASDSSLWLTGFHPVREALRARRRRLDCLWLRAGARRPESEELGDLARAAGVTVEMVDAALIDERAEGDANVQGVALRSGPLPELSLVELIDRARKAPQDSGRRLVALDGVEDPQNVGAVARVAESAGALGMILTERRAPALTAAVSRASAGAIEWLPVARVSNLGRALADLQGNDYWVVAAALGHDGGLFSLEDRILTGNLVVVLGAEGKGVRPSILDQADHRVEIPMRGEVASLNVSTAGAIILYDLLRRSESASKVRAGSA